MTVYSSACAVARPYAARSNRRYHYHCVPPGGDELRRWENQRMLSSFLTNSHFPSPDPQLISHSVRYHTTACLLYSLQYTIDLLTYLPYLPVFITRVHLQLSVKVILELACPVLWHVSVTIQLYGKLILQTLHSYLNFLTFITFHMSRT